MSLWLFTNPSNSKYHICHWIYSLGKKHSNKPEIVMLFDVENKINSYIKLFPNSFISCFLLPPSTNLTRIWTFFDYLVYFQTPCPDISWRTKQSFKVCKLYLISYCLVTIEPQGKFSTCRHSCRRCYFNHNFSSHVWSFLIIVVSG